MKEFEEKLNDLERSYRRGYLHGVLRMHRNPDLDIELVELWRDEKTTDFSP